jgi:hypothetical protein
MHATALLITEPKSEKIRTEEEVSPTILPGTRRFKGQNLDPSYAKEHLICTTLPEIPPCLIDFPILITFVD